MERQKWLHKPVITRKDVDKLRRTLKIGENLIYRSAIKETIDERIVMPKYEKVVVKKKYPHLVVVENPRRPGKALKTMTYKQILFQKRGLKWDSGSDGKEQL